ncbi:MAG: cupin domain-containing protein [Solirubrobacterales bacterium]|nr:cupin domain-containing protein [Solirubrobacterales bacterium]
MSETREWQGGWTAREPIQLGHVSMPADAGNWAPSARAGVESRDLGLIGASDGAMSVAHLRSADGAEGGGWQRHDLDFQFLYVTGGSVTIEQPGGDPVELGEGAVVHRTGGGWHRELSFSPGFEAYEITSPARFSTETAEGPGEDDSRTEISFDLPEAYERGAGPRKFFDYRDLGTMEPTDGRVHIHVVKATGEPGDGTGWHYHTMAQWFLILSGDSHIRVEDGPNTPLLPGDTMCVGYGPGQRHNVAPFSGDYAVLEMCVPAIYETTATEPPENAQPGLPGARE